MLNPHRGLAGLFVVGLGTLAAPLDTAVNIAFPGITLAFDLALEDIRWVVIAYTLTYASLMLIFGRLGDLLGYRRIFQLGLLVSLLGLTACSAAPTYGLLLLGRMLQGIGIALTLSCGPALAMSLFDDRDRTRALGFYAATTAAGAALGPLLGGILMQRWGWTAVFWFRVPLVLVALGLSWLLPAPRTAASVRKFDGVGAALLVTWISAMLLALAVRSGPFGPLLSLWLVLLWLLSFVLFLVREQRCQDPLIDPAQFGNADFAIMNLASIAVNLAAFGVLLLVPYYFMRIAGMTVVAAGAILALGAGGAVFGSWLAARLARHAHLGRLAFFGAVLCAGGLWMVSGWTTTTSRGSISLALFIQGLGLGLFQVAYTDYVAASLPVGARGVAGSLTILTRTIGVIAGATSLSAAQAYYEREALSAGTAVADAFLAGFQSTFRHVAFGLACGIALSMARPRTWLGRI